MLLPVNINYLKVLLMIITFHLEDLMYGQFKEMTTHSVISKINDANIIATTNTFDESKLQVVKFTTR